MGMYLLKTKKDEVMNKTTQENLEVVLEFFSSLKQITIKELLEIYKVEKYESRNNN